jgi:L-fuconolactonase
MPAFQSGRENLMQVIDAQVHSWEPVTKRPWVDTGVEVVRATPYPLVLAAMDAVGVHAAIIHSSRNYGVVLPDGTRDYDHTYAVEACLTHPGRFASIGYVDPLRRDVVDAIGAVKLQPGTLGLRHVFGSESHVAAFEAGQLHGMFACAQTLGLPVCLYASGRLQIVKQVAQKYPDLQLVVDHLGITQPPVFAPDPEPFQRLPELLNLAQYPNVAVKLSGAPTLSGTGYPFDDLWPYLEQVMEKFGTGRLMWGSDYTRCAPLHSYADAVGYLRHSDRLSADEKTDLMSGTVQRIFSWKAPVDA